MLNYNGYAQASALFWSLLLAVWIPPSLARAEGTPENPPPTESTPPASSWSPTGVYLTAQGGVQYFGPHAISQQNALLVDTSPSSGAGPSTAIAVGLRFPSLLVGLRATVSALPRYWYQSINYEMGLRGSFGNLEPYFLVGAGVSWVSHLKGREVNWPGVSMITDSPVTGHAVTGGNGRLSGGLSYLLFRHLAVGALVAVEATYLSRDAVQGPQEVDDGDGGAFPGVLSPNTASPYDASSAIGLGVNGSVVLELRLLAHWKVPASRKASLLPGPPTLESGPLPKSTVPEK